MILWVGEGIPTRYGETSVKWRDKEGNVGKMHKNYEIYEKIYVLFIKFVL